MRCGGPNFNGVASYLCRKFENRLSNYCHFSLPVGAMANCMEMGILYSGNLIRRILGIHSWKSCAMLCENEPICFAWSLSTSSGSCFLKDEKWKNARRNVKGFVSGTKSCIGSTRTTTAASAKTTTLETTTTTTTTTTARGITGFLLVKCFFFSPD